MMKLPPLPSLRAFEAAARKQSFAKAAQELNMTAAAVSQHVRNLEVWLGVSLFERHARGVIVTPAGRTFGAAVTAGFQTIAATAATIRSPRQRRVVRLASLSSVATYFLTPRLPRFRELHPDIQVSIHYAAGFHFDAVDLHISHGMRPQGEATALFGAETRPTCSAGYAEKYGPFTAARSLPGAELLHDETEEAWQRWFHAAGLELPDNTGPIFADFNLLVTALNAGQGIGLCPMALVGDDIAAGRLKVLPGLASDTDKSYWLREADAMSPDARILHDWLLTEATSVRDQLSRLPETTRENGLS